MAQDPPLCYCWLVKLRAPAPIVIALTTVLAIIALWALSVLPVLSGVESFVADSIESQLARLLDGLDIEVSYQSASPRIIGSVTLGGLELRSKGVVIAHAATASLEYQLSALLSGTFKSSRLRIEDLSIDTSYDEARSLMDRFTRFMHDHGTADRGVSVQAGPTIELRRVSVHIGFGDSGWAAAQIRSADLVVGEGGLLGASVAGTLTGSDPQGRFKVQRIEMPFSATVAYDLDTREASLLASLAGDSDVGRLSGIQVIAHLDTAGLRASIEPRDGLERLQASWDFASGQFAIEAAFSRWAPRSFFSPGVGAASIVPWLDASYSGSISVSTDMSLGGSSMKVDLMGVIPLDLPGGYPLLRLVASGSWKSLKVDNASLRNEALDLGFSGALSPAKLGATGLLSAQYSIRPGMTASARFDIVGSGSSWFAYAPAISVADALLSDGAISVEFEPAAISFYVEAALPDAETIPRAGFIPMPLNAVEPVATSVASRLVVEGRTSLGKKPYLEATIRFGALHLDAFPAFLEQLVGSRGVSIIEPLTVEGELAVYSDFSGLSYNSSGLLFVYEGPIRSFGVASFSGGLGLLNISAIDATVAGYTLQGSASLDYGNGAGLGFDAHLQLEDIPYAFRGTLMDGVVVVSGDYGLRVWARQEDSILNARLDLVDMPFPVMHTVSFLSTSTNIRFASATDWDVILNNLTLTQPQGVTSMLPSIAASGVFDESGGGFSTLSYVDKISALDGVADVTWELREGFKVSTKLRMSGTNGEYYVVDGAYRGGGSLDAVVSLRKAPLSRLPIPVLKGIVDADATISGSVGDPRAVFNFTANGGQRAEDVPFIAGSGTYYAGRVTLTDSRANFGGLSVSSVTVQYDIANAASELAADLSFTLFGNVFAGKLSASGVSSSPIADEFSPFASYTLGGHIDDARWTEAELGTIPFSLSMLEKDVQFSIGEYDEIKGRLGPTGDMSLALSSRLPVSFNAEGRYADASINVSVKNGSADLPFLFKLIGLPIIRVESGTARGEFRISGKIIDPTVDGAFELDNFYVSVPDFLSAPIGPITEPLYFTGKTMELSQSEVSCGDGVARVSLEASLHGGIPDDVRISVRTSEEGLVPIATRLLGLVIDGLAKADLVIEANRDRSKINGAITMTSGDIVLTTGVTKLKGSKFKTSNFSGSFDLSVGKQVKLYFPDKQVPVIYGQADPSSRLHVAFDQSRGEYSLKGDVMLRGGSLFYIQRNFYLKQAVIGFDESAGRFDPKISLEAETRTSSDSGLVVVTLRAVDSSLFKLDLTLESVPSLSESTIQQLLGQQLVGGTGEGAIDLGKVLVENSDLIPSLNVASIFERNLQALLGLDLFVVRSQVFQRWLYDLSGLSTLSGLTTETTLADYLEGTAIVGGKYIGDKLFFQAMVTLVSDPLASTSSLSLNSDVSLEWKAPHFTLNWSIKPENLDSLFIEDQSFSFSWRIPLK